VCQTVYCVVWFFFGEQCIAFVYIAVDSCGKVLTYRIEIACFCSLQFYCEERIGHSVYEVFVIFDQ
jgi:hypothetical protein